MFDPRSTIAADGPDFVNLRKAARAAIVAPAALAIGTFVVGNDSFALYAVFSAFVALVFSDYGGPPPARARAYLTGIVAGSLAVMLGGSLSIYPIAGVLGMFMVMFGATLATSFGGYTALHVAPIALGYSVSVLMPPGDLLVPERVGGWLLGGTMALMAALLLWPIERRSGLRRATAELARRLADVLAVLDAPDVARQGMDKVRAQVASLQARLATPLRPSGPTVRDIAFVQLIAHLDHAVELVAAAVKRGPGDTLDQPLVSEVRAGLERTGLVLDERLEAQTLVTGLSDLDTARTAGRARVMEAASARARLGDAAVPRMRAGLPLLALSHVVMWVEQEAARVMGAARDPLPALATAPELSAHLGDGVRAAVDRARRFARLELDPDGVIFKNSVRAGIALSAAVLLADVLPLEHGFWIALGALTVLRSSASSTYATALEAIAGTVGGFFVAALVVATIGDSPPLLWLLFPVAVAFAAFSPGAIHFAVGQAAFTVMVVILFSLLEAPGFRTAVVRVEDVALGATVAALMSLVLWPRGARVALGRALTGVYQAASAGARTFVVSSEEARQRARDDLDEAWRRAEAAFGATLAEHDEPLDLNAWVAVLQPPTLVRSLLGGLIPAVDAAPAGCEPAIDRLQASAAAVADRLAAASRGDQPRQPATLEGQPVSAPELEIDLERCISAGVDEGSYMFEAMVLVAWSSWVDELELGIERAEPALGTVAASATGSVWLVGRTRFRRRLGSRS